MERECQNGQRHGKCTDWYGDGNKEWEGEYRNGKIIKRFVAKSKNLF